MSGILILAGCLLAAPADGSDYSGNTNCDDLAPSVRKLVRQLDASRLAERESAEAELVRLGPAALDLLPQPDRRTSAETKQRLQRIKQRLQEALARQAAHESVVTLHGDNVPLSEFLTAVEKQTGNKIIDQREKFGQPLTDPKLKINLEKASFWTALDTVLDQAGMKIYPFAMEKAVAVVARSPDDDAQNNRTVYSGPFRIEPVKIIAARDLRDTDEQSMQFKLEVSWEPRLSPINLRQKFTELKAVDENGKTLPIGDTTGEIDVQVDRGDTTVELYLPLALPPRDVKKIAMLDGGFYVTVPGKTATFEFDKLTESKMVEKRIGAVTVTFESARRNGQIWEIAVLVSFDKAGEALESHRGWIFNNEAYLKTPDGKRIDNDGYETTLQTENQVGLTYLFDLPGPPDRMVFVYKTPAVIVSTRFGYQLKDIPLP